MAAQTLAVALRGESFRAVLGTSADADLVSLQAAASSTHAAMLRVLCNAATVAWQCAVHLFTYATPARHAILSELYAEFNPSVRLFNYSSSSSNKTPWWRPAFFAASSAFALLDLRFDMVFHSPVALGSMLLNVSSIAASDGRSSQPPAAIVVLFRTASHLRTGLVKDGPNLGRTYRISLRCPHMTVRGRPRVADTLHFTPRRHFATALRMHFFSEDLADKLSSTLPLTRHAKLFSRTDCFSGRRSLSLAIAEPGMLRWLSDELADSDTWKCNNSFYTLNSRPSNRALAPQHVGRSPNAPPKQPHSTCRSFALAWWPELELDASGRATIKN